MEIFHFCAAGFCNPHLLAARIFKELLPTEWSPARSPCAPAQGHHAGEVDVQLELKTSPNSGSLD